jgi:hypothetical protein
MVVMKEKGRISCNAEEGIFKNQFQAVRTLSN